MPYREHRLALLHMLSELSDERTRIDAEIERVLGQLGGIPAEKKRMRSATRVAIVGSLAGLLLAVVIAGAWIPNVRHARQACAHSEIGTIQFAADLNRFAKHSGCPTVEDLVDRGYLDLSQSIEDPWQTPYRLRCEGDVARVSSAGPDGEHETEDDIFYR